MKQIGSALVLGLVACVILVILLGYTSPGQDDLRAQKAAIAQQHARELAPLNLAVARVVRGSAAIIVGSIAAIAGGAALAFLTALPDVKRLARIRSWLIRPTKNALYPAVAAPDGHGHITVFAPVNEPRAQTVAALTNGNVDRLNGGAARQALNPKDPEYQLPEPAPIEVEPASSALTIDPVEKPHWLIVGQTGSGKSTATRYIMAQLAKRYRCEFVICEPGGIDWNNAASAVSRDGIAAAIKAVYDEFERRQTTLREADVAHISKLPGGDKLPYIYLVVEEMEAVLDDLKVTNRTLQQETLINLRQIARMGRKPGVGLIAVTQAARTDVFDSHVRTNLANVLLFRNGQGTAEMFRVGDRVNLPTIPTGEAYSLAHGHRLAFPLTDRPRVQVSRLYKETIFQLPADAEADGLGEDDQPDSPGVVTLEPELEPQNGRVYEAETAFSATVPTVPVPAQRIESRRMPTPIEAARMRAHYARTHSKTAVCMTFYGYKNDDVWEWVMLALESKI